jgi:hypothetical protein
MSKTSCVFCPEIICDASECAKGTFTHKARSIYMCNSCYSKLTNEYPEGSEVGEPTGKCIGCQAPLYKKDNNKCPVCGNNAE